MAEAMNDSDESRGMPETDEMAEAIKTATEVAACQKLRSAGTVAQDCAEKAYPRCSGLVG